MTNLGVRPFSDDEGQAKWFIRVTWKGPDKWLLVVLNEGGLSVFPEEARWLRLRQSAKRRDSCLGCRQQKSH